MSVYLTYVVITDTFWSRCVLAGNLITGVLYIIIIIIDYSYLTHISLILPFDDI